LSSPRNLKYPRDPFCHSGSFAKALVGGDDYVCALVVFAEKVEQHHTARGVERLATSSSRITNSLFTSASEILPVFLCSSAFTSSAVEKKRSACSGVRCLGAKGCSTIAFSGSGAANQHDVFSRAHELARKELPRDTGNRNSESARRDRSQDHRETPPAASLNHSINRNPIEPDITFPVMP